MGSQPFSVVVWLSHQRMPTVARPRSSGPAPWCTHLIPCLLRLGLWCVLVAKTEWACEC